MLSLKEKQALAKSIRQEQCLWSADWWVKDGVP
jgi:hypothetical protein